MLPFLGYLAILSIGFIIGYYVEAAAARRFYNGDEYISITEKGRKSLEAYLNKSPLVDEVLARKDEEKNDDTCC
tara:strand:+ start:306 stop:527 length:222 start_codon:yes stop_codon:yes gene_type:complete